MSRRRTHPGASARRRRTLLLVVGLTLTIAVATVATLAARGAATPHKGSLEESRGQLMAEVDRISRGPLGHLRWRPEPAVAPALCEGPGGVPAAQERTASVGIEAPLPASQDPAEVVASVEAEWRARGLAEIRQDAADPRAPVLSAGRDRLLLELVVNVKSRRVFLGGSTPCLRPEPLRRAG